MPSKLVSFQTFPAIVPVLPLEPLSLSIIVPSPVSLVLPTLPLTTLLTARVKVSLLSATLSSTESTRTWMLVSPSGIVTSVPLTASFQFWPLPDLYSKPVVSRSLLSAVPSLVVRSRVRSPVLASLRLRSNTKGSPSVAEVSPIVRSAPELRSSLRIIAVTLGTEILGVPLGAVPFARLTTIVSSSSISVSPVISRVIVLVVSLAAKSIVPETPTAPPVML